MAPTTRRGPNTPDNNANPNNMTPESIQIEKMESIFNISGYAIENQVKFATCTLLGAALTWWNELANETEKVDKYISGLPDNIYGNIKSARPKTLDETIELANDLIDQKLRTYVEM
ncbi:hypothetical protein Tco_0162402 [Tanacetum coccineum]